MVLNTRTWDSHYPHLKQVRLGARITTTNSGFLSRVQIEGDRSRTGADVGLGRGPSPGAGEGLGSRGSLKVAEQGLSEGSYPRQC